MNEIIRLIALVFTVVLTGALPSAAEPVLVHGEGSGATPQDAIFLALTQAVQQVNGMSLATATNSIVGLQTLAGETNQQRLMSDEFRSQIRSSSSGIVRSYDIVSIAPAAKGFTAQLNVTVEKFEPPGLPTARRTLVVLPISNNIKDGEPFVRGLREQLIVHLSQTRRFSVLDREHVNAYAEETQLITSDAAPLTEKVRVGQVLGADYLVMGRLRDFSISPQKKLIEITGEVQNNELVVTDIYYQVVAVATRQIKWANSIFYKSSVPSGGGIRTASDAIAAAISDDVSLTVYPLRIIDAHDPDNLVINQGGITVSVGKKYRAMLLGPLLFDPNTNEPLGPREQEVGIVQIMRVDPKMSEARLVSGAISGGELILRPILEANVMQFGSNSPKRTPFD